MRVNARSQVTEAVAIASGTEPPEEAKSPRSFLSVNSPMAAMYGRAAAAAPASSRARDAAWSFRRGAAFQGTQSTRSVAPTTTESRISGRVR